MTAIAYREGYLAADSASWVCGGKVKIKSAKKITRLLDGGLVTFAGDVDVGNMFVKWILDGRDYKISINEDTGFSGFYVNRDFQATWFGPFLMPVPMTNPYFALGAPSEFLWGALAAGASAEEAVRLAIVHTDGAGGEVQVEKVG